MENWVNITQETIDKLIKGEYRVIGIEYCKYDKKEKYTYGIPERIIFHDDKEIKKLTLKLLNNDLKKLKNGLYNASKD